MRHGVRHAAAGIAVLLSALLVAPAAARARTCHGWTAGVQPPGSGSAEIHAVSVLSTCNAWAVGLNDHGSQAGGAQILHWNGTAWHQVPTGIGFFYNELFGVDVVARNLVWAVGVGEPEDGTVEPVIARWNGSVWQHTSTLPGGDGTQLQSVSATGPRNAWAVGVHYRYFPARHRSLPVTWILHWNGTAWRHVRSPNPGTSKNWLLSVSAVSGSNAWAVGWTQDVAGSRRTLVLHWNGTAWRHVASPNANGRDNVLNSVSATAGGAAVAVGQYSSGGLDRTLALRWTGTRWVREATPNAGFSATNALSSVALASADAGWAVGGYSAGPRWHTLMLHWNGTAWHRVAVADPGNSAVLQGVGLSSATDVWAVGYFEGTNTSGYFKDNLALHCC